MNNNAFLPLSTRNGGNGNIDLSRIEQGYSFIAQSISDFARQQAILRSDLITDDLIRTFNEKSGLVQSCADAGLIELYEHKSLDLQNERS